MIDTTNAINNMSGSSSSSDVNTNSINSSSSVSVSSSVTNSSSSSSSSSCDGDVRSSLTKMLEQENHYALRHDYLNSKQHHQQHQHQHQQHQHHQQHQQHQRTSYQEKNVSDSADMSACRRLMAEWCAKVVNRCRYHRETLSYALSYLDRYLASLPSERYNNMETTRFQLVAMTCLYIAYKVLSRMDKLNDTTTRQTNTNTASTATANSNSKEILILNSNIISQWTAGVYTPRDVEAMELELLFALDWRCHPPTSRAFVHHLVQLTRISDHQKQRVLERALAQVDHVAIDYYYSVLIKQSWVAYCAVVNAIVHIKLCDVGAVDMFHVIHEMPLQKKNTLRNTLGEAFEIFSEQTMFRGQAFWDEKDDREDNDSHHHNHALGETTDSKSENGTVSISPRGVRFLPRHGEQHALSQTCAINLLLNDG